jgi:hypothetical protein
MKKNYQNCDFMINILKFDYKNLINSNILWRNFLYLLRKQCYYFFESKEVGYFNNEVEYILKIGRKYNKQLNNFINEIDVKYLFYDSLYNFNSNTCGFLIQKGKFLLIFLIIK